MYGVQILTTDGVKDSLNFFAGRFLGTASVSLSQANTTYQVTLPTGTNLTNDVVFCQDYYTLQNINCSILVDLPNNTLSVKTPTNVVFNNPISIPFLFVRFQ